MRDWLRALIERVLPWYDPISEAIHDARTEQIRQRSIRARMRAEGERERVATTIRRAVDGVHGR